MAISNTTRLGITRWSSGSDPFTRSQLDSDHDKLETKVVGFEQGTSRPVASVAYKGFFYLDTVSGLLSYCTGTEWVETSGFGINGLADVTITSPSSNHVIYYDGAEWVNGAAAAAGLASSGHNHAGTYATTGHNHDGVYATTAHDHSVHYDAQASSGLTIRYGTGNPPAGSFADGSVYFRYQA